MPDAANATPAPPAQPDAGETEMVGEVLTATVTGSDVHEPVPLVTVMLVLRPPPVVTAVHTPVPDTIVAAEGVLEFQVVLPAPPDAVNVNVFPGAAVHKEVVLRTIVGVVFTTTAAELA